MDFNEINSRIAPPDEAAATAARERWNSLAKPVGSLGLLEQVVVKMSALVGGRPKLDRRAVTVFCADNGVTAAGVASTPPEITAVMAGFIAERRSAVCIMARAANAEVIPVDMGMFGSPKIEGLLPRAIAPGTRDMTAGPAMTREQACRAIAVGLELVERLRGEGYGIICTGEMGIGNTTTSSAVAAALLRRRPDEMVGRGAGLSDEGLARKLAAIERAFEVNRPDPNDPLGVLAAVGGFDIAAMAGVFIGGAIYRLPVVVDGFISGVAALTALRLCPASSCSMIAGHLSAEPAAAAVLDELGLKPLITAGLRLGEGTGAVAALPLLDMALEVYDRLMTFADIGMSQ